MDRPLGPRGMAEALEANLAQLKLQRAVVKSRAERRTINQRIDRMRELLRWCKTRAGY